MKKAQAKGAKENFWNDLRVKNGLLVKDLAELLHVSIGTAGGWFSGRSIPTELNLNALCSFFGVDRNKGYEEFVKANRDWDSERGSLSYKLCGPDVPDAPKQRRGPRKMKEMLEELPEYQFKEEVIPATVSEPEVPEEPKSDTRDESDFYRSVLTHFYGKLPYEKYVQIMVWVAEKKDLLEEFYGNFTFEEFTQLVHIRREFLD